MVPRNWSRTQWWSANTSLFCDKMIQYHLWRTMMGFPGHKTQIYVWGPTHQPYNPIIWAILWILYIIPYTIYVSISKAILYHMIKEKIPMIVEISNDGSLSHHLIFLDSFYRSWAADQLIFVQGIILGQIFCPRSQLSQLIFVQGIIFGTNILSKVKIVSVIQEYKGHNCLSNTRKVKQTFWQRRDLADLFLFWYFCQYLFVIHFYIFLRESELNLRDLKKKDSNHSFLSLDDHSSQKFPQVPKLSITKYSKQALPRNCLRTWKTSFKFFTKMEIICKFFKILIPAFRLLALCPPAIIFAPLSLVFTRRFLVSLLRTK